MTEAKTSLKRTLIGKVVSDKPAGAGGDAKPAVKRVRTVAAPAAAADGQ